MNTAVRILLLGAIPLALAACSESTKADANGAAQGAVNDTAANIENAGNKVETAADKAGAAVENAGDNAAAAAANAKQNTGEAIEQAGKDMQKPN